MSEDRKPNIVKISWDGGVTWQEIEYLPLPVYDGSQCSYQPDHFPYELQGSADVKIEEPQESWRDRKPLL